MTATMSAGILDAIEKANTMDTPEFTLQNSILIALSFRKIGTTRKAKKESIDFGTVRFEGKDRGVDKDYMEAEAKILKSETLDLISRRDNQVAKWVGARGLPMTRLFKSGFHLLPPALVEEVVDYLDGYKQERSDLAETFSIEYLGIKEAMRDRLGPHFNESFYYGTEEMVRAQFEFDYRLVAFNVPVTLKGISEQMYKREEERVRAALRAQAKDIEDTLAVSALGLLNWLQEQLTSDEKGRKKAITDSKLDYMKEFFENLAARNITGNKTLEQVAEQGRVVMGLAAGTRDAYNALKENTSYREIIQGELEKVKEIVAPLITLAPSRKFQRFEDDE